MINDQLNSLNQYLTIDQLTKVSPQNPVHKGWEPLDIAQFPWCCGLQPSQYEQLFYCEEELPQQRDMGGQEFKQRMGRQWASQQRMVEL